MGYHIIQYIIILYLFKKNYNRLLQLYPQHAPIIEPHMSSENNLQITFIYLLLNNSIVGHKDKHNLKCNPNFGIIAFFQNNNSSFKLRVIE